MCTCNAGLVNGVCVLRQSIEFFLAKTVTHFVTDKAIDRDGNLLNVSSSQHLSPSPLFVSQSPSPAQKSASHQSLLFLDLNDSGTSHELSNDERVSGGKKTRPMNVYL